MLRSVTMIQQQLGIVLRMLSVEQFTSRIDEFNEQPSTTTRRCSMAILTTVCAQPQDSPQISFLYHTCLQKAYLDLFPCCQKACL